MLQEPGGEDKEEKMFLQTNTQKLIETAFWLGVVYVLTATVWFVENRKKEPIAENRQSGKIFFDLMSPHDFLRLHCYVLISGIFIYQAINLPKYELLGFYISSYIGIYLFLVLLFDSWYIYWQSKLSYKQNRVPLYNAYRLFYFILFAFGLGQSKPHIEKYDLLVSIIFGSFFFIIFQPWSIYKQLIGKFLIMIDLGTKTRNRPKNSSHHIDDLNKELEILNLLKNEGVLSAKEYEDQLIKLKNKYLN